MKVYLLEKMLGSLKLVIRSEGIATHTLGQCMKLHELSMENDAMEQTTNIDILISRRPRLHITFTRALPVYFIAIAASRDSISLPYIAYLVRH